MNRFIAEVMNTDVEIVNERAVTSVVISEVIDIAMHRVTGSVEPKVALGILKDHGVDIYEGMLVISNSHPVTKEALRRIGEESTEEALACVPRRRRFTHRFGKHVARSVGFPVEFAVKGIIR